MDVKEVREVLNTLVYRFRGARRFARERQKAGDRDGYWMWRGVATGYMETAHSLRFRFRYALGIPDPHPEVTAAYESLKATLQAFVS